MNQFVYEQGDDYIFHIALFPLFQRKFGNPDTVELEDGNWRIVMPKSQQGSTDIFNSLAASALSPYIYDSGEQKIFAPWLYVDIDGVFPYQVLYGENPNFEVDNAGYVSVEPKDNDQRAILGALVAMIQAQEPKTATKLPATSTVISSQSPNVRANSPPKQATSNPPQRTPGTFVGGPTLRASTSSQKRIAFPTFYPFDEVDFNSLQPIATGTDESGYEFVTYRVYVNVANSKNPRTVIRAPYYVIFTEDPEHVRNAIVALGASWATDATKPIILGKGSGYGVQGGSEGIAIGAGSAQSRARTALINLGYVPVPSMSRTSQPSTRIGGAGTPLRSPARLITPARVLSVPSINPTISPFVAFLRDVLTKVPASNAGPNITTETFGRDTFIVTYYRGEDEVQRILADVNLRPNGYLVFLDGNEYVGVTFNSHTD